MRLQSPGSSKERSPTVRHPPPPILYVAELLVDVINSLLAVLVGVEGEGAVICMNRDGRQNPEKVVYVQNLEDLSEYRSLSKWDSHWEISGLLLVDDEAEGTFCK